MREYQGRRGLSSKVEDKRRFWKKQELPGSQALGLTLLSGSYPQAKSIRKGEKKKKKQQRGELTRMRKKGDYMRLSIGKGKEASFIIAYPRDRVPSLARRGRFWAWS